MRLPAQNSIRKLYTLVFAIAFATMLGFSCTHSKQKSEASVKGITRSAVSYPDLIRSGDKYFSNSKFDSALAYYERAAAIIRLENKPEDYFNLLLKETDVHRMIGNAELASQKISEAQSLLNLHFSGNHKFIADILHRKGILSLDKGEFDDSYKQFNLSINERIKGSSPKDSLLAPTFNAIGTYFFYKGKYDAALENYKKAYELAAKRKLSEDVDLARYLQNIGIIYAQKGDYLQAFPTLTNSMKISEKLMDSTDPDLANRYLNMGQLIARMNKDMEAIEYYDKSESILKKQLGNNHPEIGNLYQNIGQLYIHMGDYEKALIFFNKALTIALANYAPQHPVIPAIYMNIGYVYKQKKDFSNALHYYKLSVPLTESNVAAIKTFSNMASLYASVNKIDSANYFYLKSLNLADKLMGAEHPETSLLYTRYGNFLINSGLHIETGLAYLNKAVALSIKIFGQKSREASNNYISIGYYYLKLNEPSKALQYYQKALIAITKDFNDENIISNPSLSQTEPDRYLVNALNGKASALKRFKTAKELKVCLDTYKLAILLIEKLRSGYQNEESKLLLAEDERKTFQNAVEVATALYRLTGNQQFLEEAFTTADRGKSAILFASMQDLEAKQFGGIPEDIQRTEKNIKLDLGSYQRFIYEENQKPVPDLNKIHFWESKIFEYETRYDSLVLVLEKEYPEYYSIKYKEPDIQFTDIQKLIEPDRAVVEYMLTDSVIYAFVIDKKSASVVTHPLDSLFFGDIQIMRDATNSNDIMSLGKNDYINYSRAAYHPYQCLIEPLKESTSLTKLIIIPDAEIGYLSFDMLITAPAKQDEMDFRELPYLIRNYVISYSASATLQFATINRATKKADKNLLAMAPTYDNLTNLKENAFIDENGQKVYLLPIPGVEYEINGIRKVLNCTTYSGEEATEKNFKRVASRYNILHLAMHTLVNNEKPMLSKLVFYQDNDSTDDGMLNTYELFGMKLNAGLAVLSACNTGTGKLMQGEGMMNLARGFKYAGVPGIVMTLWAVDDQSGAGIVSKFYRYLEKGMPKDEALRQAKLDLLNEGDPLRSHPYYWAAYVSIGDYSPMKFIATAWISWLYLLITISAATGFAQLFIINNRRTGKS